MEENNHDFHNLVEENIKLIKALRDTQEKLLEANQRTAKNGKGISLHQLQDIYNGVPNAADSA